MDNFSGADWMKVRLIFIALIVIISIQTFISMSFIYKFILFVIEIGFIAYLWLKSEKEWKSKLEHKNEELVCNKKILEVLQIYRHDWQNHLQMILGYVSLKKYEQIPQYIKKITYHSKQRSKITSLTEFNLAAFLFMIPINYPKLSSELDIAEGFETFIDKEIGDLMLEAIKGFIELFYKTLDKNIAHHLIISFARTDHVIIVNLEFEGNTMEINKELLQLGSNFNRNNNRFLVDIDNEQEFIMELHFSLKQ